MAGTLRAATEWAKTGTRWALAWCSTPVGWSVGCGLIVALPAIGVVGRLWQLGWSPQGDNAALAQRAWMITDGHPTFTGPYTLGTNTGAWTYNPGPLYFWVLALPTRLAPGNGPLFAVGALGVAALIAGMVAVGQVGGRWLQIVVTAGGLVGAHSAASALIDPTWNAYTVLLPFVGLLLMTWAITVGRLGWWPAAVFLGSFCAQTHLTYSLPATLAVLVAPPLGVLALRQRGEALRWRWLAAGVVVGALSWVLPLWEQATAEPGNLRTLWWTSRHFQGDTLGFASSLRYFSWSVAGNPPLWLHRPDLHPFEVVVGRTGTHPMWGAVVLLGLVVALVVGLRRREHDVAGIAAIALVTSAGCICATQGVSASTWFWTAQYLVTVLYPIGMVATLALGWSAWRLVLQPIAAREGVVPLETWRTLFAALAVAALLTTWWMVRWARATWDEPNTGWPTLAAISDQTVDLVVHSDEPPGRLAIDASALANDLPGIVPRSVGYGLVVHGWTPTYGPFHQKMYDNDDLAALFTDRTMVYRRAHLPAPAHSTRLGTIHEPASDHDYDVYIVEPLAD